MDPETIRTGVMAVGAIIGTWITAGATRRAAKASAEQQLVDQYQERQAEMEGRLDKQQDRLDSQQTQMDKLASLVARLTHRDLLWDFHATRVEDQVTQLGGQPYPRPEGLHPLAEENTDG